MMVAEDLWSVGKPSAWSIERTRKQMECVDFAYMSSNNRIG